MLNVAERKDLARLLLESGTSPWDLAPDADLLPPPPTAVLTADLGLVFPPGLAAVPRPAGARPNPNAPLPQADVVVITWTVAENNGLADVLTPGFARAQWYRYTRDFENGYAPLIREGAPASKNRRLGSWFPTRIGSLRVICFKSELHLNQDGKPLDEDGRPAEGKTGFATLPVKKLFHQIMDEVDPRLVITTGTSGATFLDHDLGDVVVTRGAKFRLSDEFRKEPFNAIDIPGAQYTSQWDVPTGHFEEAIALMESFQHRLVEPAFAPPTKRYPFAGPPIEAPANTPDIKLDDGRMMPAFHPILTTDFFEFGTSANELELQGSAVEMGDAVLGLACEERDDPPDWLVVRNLSDPQINADLPTKPRSLDMQAHWAVWYYEKYGYWTSVNGALACWAVIAGLEGRDG